MHGSESIVVLQLWHIDSGQLVCQEEIKLFTFAYLPQRNVSFQVYVGLSYSDVSHKAVTDLCSVTSCGVL